MTSKQPPSAPDRPETYAQSLRDGRIRLVGLIDGYPSYYDRQRHRIDVLLENGDGERYLSEYYWLRPEETVREYIGRAEREGYSCNVLARWTPKRHRYNETLPVPRRFRRYAHRLYTRLSGGISRERGSREPEKA